MKLSDKMKKIRVRKIGSAPKPTMKDKLGESGLHHGFFEKDLGKSFDSLKKDELLPHEAKSNRLKTPNFPDDPLTLSNIQEHLLRLPGNDLLSMIIRLSAKTDLRDCIKLIQEMNDHVSSTLVNIIEPNILELILLYENRA